MWNRWYAEPMGEWARNGMGWMFESERPPLYYSRERRLRLFVDSAA